MVHGCGFTRVSGGWRAAAVESPGTAPLSRHSRHFPHPSLTRTPSDPDTVHIPHHHTQQHQQDHDEHIEARLMRRVRPPPPIRCIPLTMDHCGSG